MLPRPTRYSFRCRAYCYRYFGNDHHGRSRKRSFSMEIVDLLLLVLLYNSCSTVVAEVPKYGDANEDFVRLLCRASSPAIRWFYVEIFDGMSEFNTFIIFTTSTLTTPGEFRRCTPSGVCYNHELRIARLHCGNCTMQQLPLLAAYATRVTDISRHWMT